MDPVIRIHTKEHMSVAKEREQKDTMGKETDHNIHCHLHCLPLRFLSCLSHHLHPCLRMPLLLDMFRMDKLIRVVVVLLEVRIRPVPDVVDVRHGGGKGIGWLSRTFQILY